uniref:Uncharacterized protein n=1 Tax=viral metagenome TaxID=1070528 RepID=A0A6M3IJF5_9ZZZZ
MRDKRPTNIWVKEEFPDLPKHIRSHIEVYSDVKDEEVISAFIRSCMISIRQSIEEKGGNK